MMLRQRKIRLNASFQLSRHDSVAFTEQKLSTLSFGITNAEANYGELRDLLLTSDNASV